MAGSSSPVSPQWAPGTGIQREADSQAAENEPSGLGSEWGVDRDLAIPN